MGKILPVMTPNIEKFWTTQGTLLIYPLIPKPLQFSCAMKLQNIFFVLFFETPHSENNQLSTKVWESATAGMPVGTIAPPIGKVSPWQPKVIHCQRSAASGEDQVGVRKSFFNGGQPA